MHDIPEIDITPDDYDWSTFDRDAFKTWLETDAPGVLPQHVDLWLRAVDHRFAWKSGRAYSWDSPQRLVSTYWDIFGPCAWIGQKGEIYPCDYASHDRVCEIIIGDRPGEVEKTHARLSQYVGTCESTWQYVHRPSRKMQNTVIKYMQDHRDYFTHCRDIP